VIQVRFVLGTRFSAIHCELTSPPVVAWQESLGYWLGVSQQNFSDSALVLVGHGTRFDPDAAAPVYQHAAELRRRQIFGAVQEAFWKQQPRLLDVLPALKCGSIFVAPFFLSEGYFSERIIPAAMGFKAGQDRRWNRVQIRGAQTLSYCNVPGTHPDLVHIALHRAQEVVEKFPFPRCATPGETSLIVAGHGTERDQNSRETIERLVASLRALNAYAEAHAVYLEEPPRISEAYDLAQNPNLVVVPFFVGEGPHVKRDIPMALGQPEHILRQRVEAGHTSWRNPTEKNGKLVWYAQPVGTDARMADIVLERVREAARWPKGV